MVYGDSLWRVWCLSQLSEPCSSLGMLLRVNHCLDYTTILYIPYTLTQVHQYILI